MDIMDHRNMAETMLNDKVTYCDKCNWFRFKELAKMEWYRCQVRKFINVKCQADGVFMKSVSKLSKVM